MEVGDNGAQRVERTESPHPDRPGEQSRSPLHRYLQEVVAAGVAFVLGLLELREVLTGSRSPRIPDLGSDSTA
jgi:hypothetical protein